MARLGPVLRKRTVAHTALFARSAVSDGRCRTSLVWEVRRGDPDLAQGLRGYPRGTGFRPKVKGEGDCAFIVFQFEGLRYELLPDPRDDSFLNIVLRYQAPEVGIL